VRVRWGLVAYRDVDDAVPLEIVPFADAPDALIAKVGTRIRTGRPGPANGGSAASNLWKPTTHASRLGCQRRHKGDRAHSAQNKGHADTTRPADPILKDDASYRPRPPDPSPQHQVKSLQAAGGGDEPEDMAAALATAAGLDWCSKARFLVVLADAPPHGSECHDLAAGADRYPGGSPTPGAGLAEVMDALRKNEVRGRAAHDSVGSGARLGFGPSEGGPGSSLLWMSSAPYSRLDQIPVASLCMLSATLDVVASDADHPQIDLMMMPVKKGRLDKTLAAFRRHYERPDSTHLKLTVEPLFNAAAPPAGAFHFVFCLDCSGSMSGRPWADVVQAYGQLLARRRSDQNQGDVVSVVTFCSSPHVAAAVTPIDAAPSSLPYSGGGTCFAPALAECQRLLEAAPARYTPVLIFMSDGEDCSSGATQAVQQLCSRLRMCNLQVHTIAFGSGIKLLEDMAAAAGSAGQYHAAAGGLQLQQVFVQIAAECSAVDGLVREFAQKLTEMISVKIMVDYL
jgi:Mg-chelatase subunit ChlD